MIDHLIYATPNLEQGIQEMEALLGVVASRGGQHPNWGTHNALISLGSDIYLEIIAPDPRQSIPATIFQLEGLTTSKLVTWAAKARLDQAYWQQLQNQGIALGALISGARQKPDGTILSWQLTDPAVELEHGLLPFLIDWGQSPHPAQSTIIGGSFHQLIISHPSPILLKKKLAMLGLEVPVVKGPQGLKAQIATTHGLVELSTF